MHQKIKACRVHYCWTADIKKIWQLQTVTDEKKETNYNLKFNQEEKE